MIVGIDIGYGFTKATDGERTVVFPSVAGDALRADFDNELIKAGAGHILTVGGQAYFYGQQAQKHSRNPLALFARERTEQEDLMEVLLCAALGELGAGMLGKERVQVCSGLPVDFYADKAGLEALLLGAHLFEFDGQPRTVHVCQAAVVPQPFGSFFDQALDNEGALINAPFARGKVGILDVGTYTTDYALSDGLEYVAKASGSKTVAMSTVWRQVRDGIKAQWGIEYELHQVDGLMRNGRAVTVQGLQRSIEPLIGPAVDGLAGQVLAGARERWGAARDFARILLTGGGAEYVKERVIEVYPHAQLVSQAHLGNLRGFFKYARRKFGRNQIANG